MNLRQQLDADMKTAMKSRDSLRLETIRGVRGAIRNKEIEAGGELDDEAVLRVIRTLVKQRNDSIEQYQAAGRSELAEKESAEKGVLEEYLPVGRARPPDPSRSCRGRIRLKHAWMGTPFATRSETRLNIPSDFAPSPSPE